MTNEKHSQSHGERDRNEHKSPGNNFKNEERARDAGQKGGEHSHGQHGKGKEER